ncbi:xanthine dehydrogenase accessory protein XdhC [Sulfitobacter sp. G21635-S1]|uniref:xanthine dehydrogenase accessory protein XdhC n=1 Tax=Sulfitobacter sp. G21635-S1 TaxID=3014043 RepID=UPI0022B07B49|nr:xanthine dehydrogenase accessory protein XdhC [Sulfitobacter sp. G21635-S1]MCZ4256700.1 xanthine dehydrogenase accessory protein XdhC [Sulfitobacter sp. G21635-S1]
MRLSQFLDTNADIVRVSLCRVRGSSPREAGAEMFVAPNGLHGTIGGGQLEYMAIDQARKMLGNGRDFDRMDVPLGPEIGQCCGGRVELALQRMTQADRALALAADAERQAARPHVYVLGAGHIGRALARFFQFLPVRCILIDSRPEELALVDAKVETRLTPMAEAEIRAAPPGSAFIVLTHDHALDFLLTSEALDRRDAAYVGLIGSATKRMKFARFHQSHAAQSDCTRLICPIGDTKSPDKRPEVIAASVTAQVMSVLTTAQSEDVKLTI